MDSIQVHSYPVSKQVVLAVHNSINSNTFNNSMHKGNSNHSDHSNHKIMKANHHNPPLHHLNQWEHLPPHQLQRTPLQLLHHKASEPFLEQVIVLDQINPWTFKPAVFVIWMMLVRKSYCSFCSVLFCFVLFWFVLCSDLYYWCGINQSWCTCVVVDDCIMLMNLRCVDKYNHEEWSHTNINTINPQLSFIRQIKCQQHVHQHQQPSTRYQHSETSRPTITSHHITSPNQTPNPCWTLTHQPNQTNIFTNLIDTWSTLLENT